MDVENMRIKKLYSLFVYFVTCLLLSAPSIAGISFNQNQTEIVIAPACNHVPINIPYNLDTPTFDESLITVSSDSNWAIPSVDSESNGIQVAFSTKNLIVSYTATISVNDGNTTTELFIHANVGPLDIYRLLDDPLRSKTYGIQRNGINKGSLVAFDPIEESLISCITTGKGPTDFVINDDSTELLIINSVDESINVINLETFSLKETINLPNYSAWGDPDDTTANIDLGPEGIIYYSDGSWGPILNVLNRNSGEVIQSIIFDGSSPTNDTGFMDFAVTSDKTKMVAMPQYGWSAGAHSSIIGQFAINVDGTISFVKKTSLSSFNRAPFEAPVLISNNDQTAIMKTISTNPENTDDVQRVFPSAVWSMNANGSVVATADKLYDYDTGIELYTIPDASLNGSGYTYTKAQAFTSDFTRFVYFNSSDRTLNVVNLIDEIGLDKLGRSQLPKNNAIVNSPSSLTWTPLSGVDQYDIYLGTDEALIASANTESPLYLGRVTGTTIELLEPLINGTSYYWRVDPVTNQGPETASVYTFTVSEIELDKNAIDVQTVAGHSDFQVDIQLTSNEPGFLWSASAENDWITFTETTGSTPSTLNIHLDTSTLTEGIHNSTITITSTEGPLKIPVQLRIDPLKITHIRNDRNSAKAYIISEDNNGAISRAYLLEIDTLSEKIQRVIPVGSSVTDLTIHNADNLLYVTNWKSGNLLVIDKNSFIHIKSIAFQPAGATGYSQGDVYRVAAGVSGRLVIEEEDQWIDISIFNTNSETKSDSTNVREGGGAFGPTGRYYYHGENNSSGASIIKFDTSGDAFTQIEEVRPTQMSSYYGSRTVIVSEDGSRIFWSGVALNSNLETEWFIGETIYSASSDGRYAFGETAIYDINLRRQILTMPVNSIVSGYNSNSEKLIVQKNSAINYYPISTLNSLPSPVLTASNPTKSSIELNWTDESLEMEFNLQQRIAGSTIWTNIKTNEANNTNWTANNLQSDTSYEFRVRASTTDNSSAWSDVAVETTLQNTVVQQPDDNEEPIDNQEPDDNQEPVDNHNLDSNQSPDISSSRDALKESLGLFGLSPINLFILFLLFVGSRPTNKIKIMGRR